MNLSIENIKAQFQAVASIFVQEGDESIANLNKLLYSEELNVKKIAEEIRKLSASKMNLMVTQEELNKIVIAINEQKKQQTDSNEDVNNKE